MPQTKRRPREVARQYLPGLRRYWSSSTQGNGTPTKLVKSQPGARFTSPNVLPANPTSSSPLRGPRSEVTLTIGSQRQDYTNLTSARHLLDPIEGAVGLVESHRDEAHRDRRHVLTVGPLLELQLCARIGRVQVTELYGRMLSPSGKGAGLQSLEARVGRRLIQLAILVTARAHDSQYDWTVNEPKALEAGRRDRHRSPWSTADRDRRKGRRLDCVRSRAVRRSQRRRRQIRTNNPLERIIREVRRCTRVVGAFPDGQSALMLVAARLRHIAATKWGTRRYLTAELLQTTKQRRAAA